MAAIAGGATPGSAVNPAPLYKLPALGLFSFVVAAVSLGIARGAIADLSRIACAAAIGTYTGKRLADLGGVQLRLAEASALADIAEALMLKDCDEATRMTAKGAVPDTADKARWRRDGAYAAGICTKAVELIFTASGGAGDLSRQADPARLPRRPRRERALCAELGRERHPLGPRRPRPLARHTDALSRADWMESPSLSVTRGLDPRVHGLPRQARQ